jgi:hypothetical protein
MKGTKRPWYADKLPRKGWYVATVGQNVIDAGAVEEDDARLIVTAVNAYDDMVETLQMCAETFRKYEKLHRAKKTPEGDAKAAANHGLAESCEKSLSIAKGEPQ